MTPTPAPALAAQRRSSSMLERDAREQVVALVERSASSTSASRAAARPRSCASPRASTGSSGRSSPSRAARARPARVAGGSSPSCGRCPSPQRCRRSRAPRSSGARARCVAGAGGRGAPRSPAAGLRAARSRLRSTRGDRRCGRWWRSETSPRRLLSRARFRTIDRRYGGGLRLVLDPVGRAGQADERLLDEVLGRVPIVDEEAGEPDQRLALCSKSETTRRSTSIVDACSANAGSGRTGSTGIAPVTCQGTREPVTAIVLTDAVTRGSG